MQSPSHSHHWRAAGMALVAGLSLVVWEVESKPPARLTPSVPALLDRVITRPGSFRQSCDMRAIPRGGLLRIPLYLPAFGSEFRLSQGDLQELRAQREAVVTELVQRLKWLPAIGRIPRRPGTILDSNKPGPNPDALGDLALEVVVRLAALEALPHLLRLEGELHAILPPVGTAGTVKVPRVNWERQWSYRKAIPPPAEQEGWELSGARIMQAELLAATLQLLSGQQHGPLLESRIEQVHRRKADEVGLLRAEPSLALTPDARLEIRDLAERFLREVPRAAWRREPGPER